MGIKFANRASTSLTATVSASATAITVADASAFPALGINDHFFATIQFLNDSSETEVVKVTAVTGNTLTVDRSIETSKAFTANDIIELRITSQALADPTLLAASGVTLENNQRISLGAESGGKLEIYEDGSQNGIIKQTGTGALKISGIYGTLNNDSDQELISWDADNVGLSWRGDTGAGLKLFTKETGIGVTGTVNASDGLTADYIDLTGGESTTTTGTVSCTLIKLADPSTPASDQHLIYTEADSVGSALTNLVIHAGDDTHEKVILRVGDNNGGHVDVLKATGSGVDIASSLDVTGTVTANGVSLEAGDKLIFGAEANSSLQIYEDDDGGKSRIAQYGGGDLWVQGENISLRNDDAETLIGTGHTQAFMYWQGDTGTKGERLRTTATGIDVTGTVTADKVKLGNNEFIELGNNSELKLHFNGTDSYIAETGSGNLRIAADDFRVQNGNATVTLIQANEGGSTALHWGGGTNTGVKLETKQSGVDVSGDLGVTGTVTATTVTVGDSTGTNLELYEDSDQNAIIRQRGTGSLQITGINGSLSNDAYEQLLTWGNEAIHLSWQGAGTKGERLRTTNAGINVTGKVECKDTVAITTTGSGADPSPDLDFINLHADAIGERLGQINYYGMNDESGSGSGQTKYAWTEVRTIDVTEDSEKAQHETWVKNGASHTRVLQVQPTGIDVTGTVTGLNFQHDNDDVTDQSWSSFARNGVANALYVQQGATDKAIASFRKGSTQAGQGTEVLGVSQNGINVTGTVTCDEALTISSDGPGDDAKPDIYLYNNATAAVGERLGQITYFGKDSVGDSQNYGWHEVKTVNVTDGSEEGEMNFHIRNGNVHNRTLSIQNDGIDVTGTIDCNNSLQIRSTGSDVDAMPDLYMSNLEGAAAAQNLGMISFRGYNLATTPAIKNYADVYAQQVVVTEGGEEGKLVFDVLGAGAKVEALQVTKDGIDVTGTVTADNIDNSGTIVSDSFQSTAASTSYNLLTRDHATSAALYVQTTGTAIASFATGSLVPNGGAEVLGINSTGIDVTGDLAVSGGITSDSFTYSRAVAIQAGDLTSTALKALAGKRIVKNNSVAAASTFTLFQPTAADVGKSWIICNASTHNITIDPDTQNVWILDGVTLAANESSWIIKKGGVAELVCIDSHADGGQSSAPTFIIFGAGIIEV